MVLKVALRDDPSWTYGGLAEELAMSSSEVHAAVKRATRAGLLQENRRHPNRTAILELLLHGLKYVFVAERSGVTRGVPTAHAAPPLNKKIAQGDDLPPVWPFPEGTVRGEALLPLYKSVPIAAQRDSKLYEALALVDAVRSGRARERKLAETLLTKMFSK